MQANFNKLDSFISKGNLCYFLVMGNEDGKISSAVQKLIDSLLNGKDDPFNPVYYEYSQIKKNPAMLNEAMRSITLFGDKKVVILQGCGERIHKDVEKVLDRNQGNAYLVCVARDAKKTSPIFKTIDKLSNSLVVMCYKEEGASHKSAIKSILDAKLLEYQEISYESGILDLLADFLPSNQLIIENEIEKLLLYKKAGQIELEDIIDVVSDTAELSLHDLCTAIATANKSLIQKQFQKIKQDGANFVFVLRVLQNYFQRLLDVKNQMDLDGKSAYQAVAGLKPPVFFRQRDDLVKIASKIGMEKVKSLLGKFVAFEAECKRSMINTETQLENMLLESVA